MAVALRASATTTTHQITVPATAEAGDWAFVFEQNVDASEPAVVVPSGWLTTNMSPLNTGYSGTPAVAWRGFWKILEEGDIGATIAATNASDDQKIMLVFYSDVGALTSVSISIVADPESTPNAGDIAANTIGASASAGDATIIVGIAGCNDAAATFSSVSPAFDAQVTAGKLRLGYKIYNGAASNLTIDKTDQGQRNYLGGLYVAVTEVVVYDLSAPTLTLGTPTVGNPALTQAHQLAASAFALAAPTVGAPALTQVHVLASGEVLLSGHVVGTPVLTVIHVLGATSVDLTAHVVGNPALSSIYNFTAPALTIGGHVAGTPALTQAHSLAVGETTLAAPVVGNPAMTQAHILGANSVALAAHVFGSPNLREGTFFVRSGSFQLPLIWVKTGGVWVEVEEVSFRRNGAWQSLYRN